MAWQRSIRRKVATEGVGIHTGARVRLALRPAPANTGVVFVRTDAGVSIAARAENIRDITYATTLGARGAEVSTVEHLLAALAGLGVSNVFVDLDGPEVPILDGSARPFVELVETAGLEEQGASLPELFVKETVRVEDGDRWIEFRPGAALSVDYRVSYASAAVGRQRFVGSPLDGRFAAAVAPARTFGFLEEVASLKQRGLGLGGTLDNCIVVDGDRILSGALRFRDEFVRHKVLDLLGDLALVEFPVRATVVANKAGHSLHVAAVQELLGRPEAWDLLEPERVAPFTVHPYAGEQAALTAIAS